MPSRNAAPRKSAPTNSRVQKSRVQRSKIRETRVRKSAYAPPAPPIHNPPTGPLYRARHHKYNTYLTTQAHLLNLTPRLLHPLPTSTTPRPFTLRKVPGAGLAVFATRPIPPHTLLLRETPCITSRAARNPDVNLDIWDAFCALPEQERGMFLSLTTPGERVRRLRSQLLARVAVAKWTLFVAGRRVAAAAKLSPSTQARLRKFLARVSRIRDQSPGFRTWAAVAARYENNAFEFCGRATRQGKGGRAGGHGDDNMCFLALSRFNHSCLPNVGHRVRGSTARGCVFSYYSTRAVKEGEQLCVAYTTGGAEARRAHLAWYGFRCRCGLCLLEDAVGEMGERWQAWLQGHVGVLQSWMENVLFDVEKGVEGQVAAARAAEPPLSKQVVVAAITAARMQLRAGTQPVDEAAVEAADSAWARNLELAMALPW